MNQKNWMRVSAWAAVPVVVVMFAVPRAASATPILTSGGGGSGLCDPVVTGAAADLSSCALFAIDPVSGTLTGSFSGDDDVALLGFTLLESVLFSASVSAGFDSFFGLFYGDGPDDGRVVLYSDGPYRALSVDAFDVDGIHVGDALPDPELQTALLLGPGTYFLALLQAGNEFLTSEFPVAGEPQELEFLPEGFGLYGGLGAIGGGCSAEDAARCTFTLDLTATPVTSASVPEPGTLSLLALGSAAGALFRRRRTRRAQS